MPYGCCPDWIHIKGDEISDHETHEVEYLYLTSECSKGLFDLKYRIKLKRKMHNFSYHRLEEKRKQVSDQMETIYEKYKIYYGGKKISDILDTDTPLITFEAEYMEMAVDPVSIRLSSYNYQRNKGYLKEDEHPEDYNSFMSIAANIEWIQVALYPIIGESGLKGQYNQKTFLDLIQKSNSEECYTNMLYHVLKHPEVFESFCKTFAPDRKMDNSHGFKVFREHGVVGGRMDICAESAVQRIVIENKLFSGLNGIKKDETTQLNQYYNWGKETEMEPICFLVVPDFRIFRSYTGRLGEIELEIEKYDPAMLGKYIIVSYRNISEFIKNNKTKFDDSFIFFDYLDDIIAAFDNYAYSSKSEYVQAMFRQRIMELE